jgi:hypothetical protein
MAINNLQLPDIVQRIMMVLPVKFTTGTNSNVYGLLTGIAAALKLNTDMVDELFRQTNLVSSSGQYVDDYITGLSGIGRKPLETDAAYKTRYRNKIFKYNCTQTGMQNIVIDITGKAPLGVYNSGKRGAYLNARQYYDDPSYLATYGDLYPVPFTGYIQLANKPSPLVSIELSKLISAAKAAGIQIYLSYPPASQYNGKYLYDGTRSYS